VVELALAAELEAVAITDHDSVEGLAEGLAAGADRGLTVIPGVEISTSYRGCEVHVLGYCLDWQDSALEAALREFHESRKTRAQKIVARLAELGADISLEEVQEQSEGGVIGRPHVARALVARGHVGSTTDAFDRYLARGQPAYVPRERPTPEEALRILHGAGAVTSLAHPGLIGDWALVEELLQLPFDGVEVRHSEQDRQSEHRLWSLACQSGMLMTGGSDWHGAGRASRAALGEVRIPMSWVRKLTAAAPSGC
jgi:hypothetical protein